MKNIYAENISIGIFKENSNRFFVNAVKVRFYSLKRNTKVNIKKILLNWIVAMLKDKKKPPKTNELIMKDLTFKYS